MALNKYRRTRFQEQETIDGVLEQDILNNNWELFEIKRPMSFFTVTPTFIQRPELLSIKLYGKQAYWWILAKFNNIDDWWNDIQADDVIDVPNIRDIEDWYVRVKQRNR